MYRYLSNNSLAYSALSVSASIAMWYFLSILKIINEIFLPSPEKVINELWYLLTSVPFLIDTFVSLYRIFVAFLISIITAIPIGVYMGRSKILSSILSPYTIFMRYVPLSAFIPLLILWTGIGDLQKIVFLWMASFFYLVSFIADTTNSVKREYIDIALTLGASNQQILWKVVYPASLPSIMDSIRVLMGAGWTYVILAEIVASNSGIGHVIVESQRFLRTDRVMACVIIVGIIGLFMDISFKKLKLVLIKYDIETGV